MLYMIILRPLGTAERPCVDCVSDFFSRSSKIVLERVVLLGVVLTGMVNFVHAQCATK